jgi:hypothetical protein
MNRPVTVRYDIDHRPAMDALRQARRAPKKSTRRAWPFFAATLTGTLLYIATWAWATKHDLTGNGR